MDRPPIHFEVGGPLHVVLATRLAHERVELAHQVLGLVATRAAIGPHHLGMGGEVAGLQRLCRREPELPLNHVQHELQQPRPLTLIIGGPGFLLDGPTRTGSKLSRPGTSLVRGGARVAARTTTLDTMSNSATAISTTHRRFAIAFLPTCSRRP